MFHCLHCLHMMRSPKQLGNRVRGNKRGVGAVSDPPHPSKADELVLNKLLGGSMANPVQKAVGVTDFHVKLISSPNRKQVFLLDRVPNGWMG